MSITPVSLLPGNGVTSGAVQVTGTALRVSARSTAGNAQLTLIRMNSSGDWFAVTDSAGQIVKLNLKPDPSNAGIEDVSFTINSQGASEWYHFLLNSGSASSILAQIISLSAPAASGGTVPQGRTFTPSNGLTIDGATSAADLSADRTIAVNTAIATLTTSAITLASAIDIIAAGGASDLDFSSSSGLTKTGTGAVSINGAVTLAANKGIACVAGTTAIDLSLGTGTFKPPAGTFTFQGKQAATASANTIADPGTGVAIPVTTSGYVPIVTAGAETNTLAVPTFAGQVLDLMMDARVGGDRVVTSAQRINQASNTIMTFGAAGDYIRLIGVTIAGALRWQVAANDGVALS